MIRHPLLLLILCFVTKYSEGQKIEVFGGFNKNTFYDHNKDPHFISSYTSGYGYSFGVGIDSFRRKGLKHSMNHRITLSYDNYSGSLVNLNIYLGGHDSLRANVNVSFPFLVQR